MRKYPTLLFIMTKIMEMNYNHQNQVLMYLYNNIKLQNQVKLYNVVYVNTTYEKCGYFNGSLQEIILSDTNQEHSVMDSSDCCKLGRNDDGSWRTVKRGDEIVENITYILDFYED